jgi:methionyl-tRNA formyltransferase
MKRVLLLGMGPTAPYALESLAERFDVVGIVRDIKPESEGADEVAQRAKTLNIPVITDISMDSIERVVTKFKPDCTVVSSYDQIITPRILAHGRFVNVHYAPLPRYRGRAVVNWAIINGETEWAITIHVIAPGLDAGNILCQKRVPINPDDTVGNLYAAWNDILRQILSEVIERHIDGYDGEPQDESAAIYGCTRVPADGEIDWSDSTERIYALVRSLGPPYPWAYTYLDTRRIMITSASPVPDPKPYVGRVPGRIVGRSRASGHVDVLTGDGVLRIHEVATHDAEAGPPYAVITSTRQTLGLRPEDLLARLEALERQVGRLGSGDQS